MLKGSDVKKAHRSELYLLQHINEYGDHVAL